jgi:ribosomal protein L11 methylase PrmA
MRMNGTLFLSGFFYSDCEELISRAGEVGFEKKRILTRDNWAAIEFQKK